MRTFTINDAAGNDWGFWAASDEAEAIDLLMADVRDNPDAYCGGPREDEIVATEIVIEDDELEAGVAW